jgi:hypothetical protein
VGALAAHQRSELSVRAHRLVTVRVRGLVVTASYARTQSAKRRGEAAPAAYDSRALDGHGCGGAVR